MAEDDRGQHGFLGELLGLRFDHHHGVARAGDHQIEVALARLLDRRVENELAVEVADPGGRDRPQERHAADRQRRRGRDHRQDVRVVLAVMGEHGDHDLGLVLEPLGEQRPDRAVDQARGQRLLLGGPALALEEAARDLARGERLLLVVDGQREEVLAGLDRPGRDRRREHDGLTHRRQHRTIGLTGDAAAFQDQLAPAPVGFLACDLEHSVTFLGGGNQARRVRSAPDRSRPSAHAPTPHPVRACQRRRPRRSISFW